MAFVKVHGSIVGKQVIHKSKYDTNKIEKKTNDISLLVR